MADLYRVTAGDALHPAHLNQYADAIERLEAKAEQTKQPSVVDLAALAALAAGSSRGLTRRSLLFPFLRRCHPK